MVFPNGFYYNPDFMKNKTPIREFCGFSVFPAGGTAQFSDKTDKTCKRWPK